MQQIRAYRQMKMPAISNLALYTFFVLGGLGFSVGVSADDYTFNYVSELTPASTNSSHPECGGANSPVNLIITADITTSGPGNHTVNGTFPSNAVLTIPSLNISLTPAAFNINSFNYQINTNTNTYLETGFVIYSASTIGSEQITVNVSNSDASSNYASILIDNGSGLSGYSCTYTGGVPLQSSLTQASSATTVISVLAPMLFD